MRKKDIGILGFLFLYAYINIFQLPYFAWTFPLTQNWFADNGLIVFKDVIYHHTPLPLFFLYGMSKILGNNFFMLQITSFLLLVMFGWGIYLTAKQISERVGIASFFLFIISFPILFNNFNIEEMVSSVFALYAVYFFIKFYKEISYKFIFLFGFFLGLSFMGKQPSILLLPFFVAILLFANKKIIIKSLIFISLGLATSIAPIIIYFYANNALYELYYWNIVFNLTIYPALSKAYAIKEGISSTFWLFLPLLPALLLVLKGKLEKKVKFILISLMVATISLFPSFFPSFLSYKALIFYPYPLILWSVIFQKKNSKIMLVSIIAGIIFFIPVAKSFYIDYFPQNMFNKDYILDYGEDELRVVEWLKKNTMADEKIMSLGNHYITTLAHRLPKNRYVYIFPWLVYPYEESTIEIVSDPPRIVIMDERLFEDWPFLEKEWRFISIIRKTYLKEATFGTYQIYVRN